ncbi:hypothetical protein P3T36_007664 [Kitasatospora sp. MAP12-15]|uniref:RICIN domain-containing protein n=1 Tax=unclassified Kitasatospora TaxID=2633591 RepID=UPI002476E027|nr:ricin-type beta-trefoil lectin domain protein [Kitasatospora sp. MAP12-44]MDH6115688.1 hypothetical protein [Kitasatospora sp. MAP12-44]
MIKKIGFKAAALAVITACTMMGMASQAQANSGTGELLNWTPTGGTTCLDSNYGGQIYHIPCNGGGFQQWHIAPYNDSYQLVDVQTGRCLAVNDLSSGPVTGTEGCDDSNVQQLWQWSISPNGNNYFYNKYEGQCLDSGQTNLAWGSPCNFNNNYQTWALIH